MTYIAECKVKVWTYHMSLSLHKNFIESTLKTAIIEHIHCINLLFFFHECPLGGDSGFRSWRDDSSSGGGSDLGAAQNSLEVWTFTWWKGEPLEKNGFGAAQGFESGRNIHTSLQKIAWKMIPWRSINHVTEMEWKCPWLWRT